MLKKKKSPNYNRQSLLNDCSDNNEKIEGGKWKGTKSVALVSNVYLSISNVDKKAWWFWNDVNRIHFEIKVIFK